MKALNRTKNTIHGTLWGIAFRITTMIFPFIIRTIIIRKLGSEYAGLSSLFTSILSILSLSELGISTAMVYSMYKPVAEDDKQTIGAILNFYRKAYYIIGGVILALGLFLLPFIRRLIHGNIPNDINIYYLYCIYLFNTVSSYFFFAYKSALLSAYQREGDNSKFQLLSHILMYVLQIIALIFTKNYYIYIMMLPLSTMVYNISRSIFVNKHYSDIKCEGTLKQDIKQEIYKKVSALFLYRVGSATVNTLDNIVISSFLGLVILSDYNNYYFIMNAVTNFVFVIFASLTAGVGNGLIIRDKNTNYQEFFSILYINAAIVSLCTACFFGMYQDFIGIWVGKTHVFDFLTMILFCLYFYIHTVRRTVITYRSAAGMWEDTRFQPLVSSMVNLTLNLIMIRFIGVKGILLSTIIAMTVVDIPWETISLTKKLFGDTPRKYLFKLLYYFFCTVVSCAIIYYTKSLFVSSNTIIQILLDSLISICVSCVVFIAFTYKLPESKIIEKKISDIFKRRITK